MRMRANPSLILSLSLQSSLMLTPLYLNRGANLILQSLLSCRYVISGEERERKRERERGANLTLSLQSSLKR
jgi:hypothetical protein